MKIRNANPKICNGKSAIRHCLILLVLMFAATSASAEEKLSSTRKDRIGLEITVYNDNLGFIKEERKVTLPQGTHESGLWT